MNYLEIYESVSKAGDVFEIRGANEKFMEGYNSCLYSFKRFFKKNPSLNLAFENKRLLKEIELLKKEHQKEINSLELELDDWAHKYAELEKQKNQTVVKTVVKKVKQEAPSTKDVITLEYGFKKPLKINTLAKPDDVYQMLSMVINGRIKNSKDFYNDKILKKELIKTIQNAGYYAEIIT